MKNTIERALEKQKEQEIEEIKVTEQKYAERPSSTLSPRDSQQSSNEHYAQQKDSTKAATASAAGEIITDKERVDLYIDINHLDTMGLVTTSEKFTTIKEEYRYIKRPLLNAVFENNDLAHSNLIMITSCFSGEGKTFTALNLALSIATEQDRQVLLIDADVINPNICKRLNVEPGIGLLDYLKGEATIAEIIHSTNIPNLKIISAGTRDHHANELIASEKMQTLMIELSTRYHDRVCVFDTSPILGASETSVLSQMIGQGVVVVEEERTTHSQLERAISLLDPKMSTGLVLNKSKKSRKEYYGYYYASNK